MMKKTSYVITALLLCSAGCVEAQSAESNVYGGIEMGKAKLDNQSKLATTELVTAYGGSATAIQDSAVNDFRLFGGYKFNEYVELELGYLQTSHLSLAVSGTSGGGVKYNIDAAAKVSGLDYSVILRPSTAPQYKNVFARVGITNYKDDLSGTATAGGNTFNLTGTGSGMGTLYGMGYDAPLGGNTHLRLSVNKFIKIVGQSDLNAVVYSVGFVSHFESHPFAFR